MVFPRNDVLGATTKRPYRWRVTTQIWEAKIHRRTTSQKHHLDLSSHLIAVEFLQFFLKCHFERKPETSQEPETRLGHEIFFRLFGPQFGLKMGVRGGGGTGLPGPHPWIRHCRLQNRNSISIIGTWHSWKKFKIDPFKNLKFWTIRNFSRVKLWFVYTLFPYLINWHDGQGYAILRQTRLQGLGFQ